MLGPWLYVLGSGRTVTRAVVDELVAGQAFAVVASGDVHTALRAAPVVVLALVLAAAVGRLVLRVLAVRLLVANLLEGDARPVPALEMSLGVALRRRRVCDREVQFVRY